MPPARSHVARRNQRQMLLFAALTLLLTVVAVWGGHIWLRDSETLVFAVGDANGLEARFAARLATVLKNSSSRLHLKIVPNGDNSRALAEFDHRQADIAVLRTDAKVPPHARALAVLEHDVVLLISPGRQEDQVARRSAKKEGCRFGERRQQRGASSAICWRSPMFRMPLRGSRWRP